MPLNLDVTLRALIDGAPIPDVIAFPVANLHGEIKVPGGLPESVAGVAIPGSLEKAYCERFGFEAKVAQTLVVSQGPGVPTLLAVGIGDPTTPDVESWRQGAAAVVRNSKGARTLFLLPLPSTVVESELGESVAIGALLASYQYHLRSEEPKGGLGELDVVPVAASGVSAQAAHDLEAGVERGRAIATATAMARDLVNRVPSEMTPRRLAASTLRRLEASPRVSVEVWREDRIKEEKLGGLAGVAKGSSEPPRVVIATYEPAPAPLDAAVEITHVVLVGKGITFDSGGLSLKTATGMTTMKTDMTGAAVVLSALSACAALGVKARVTAIAPMAENMPSGTAMKPGDVLTARNGTTIEVLNTDAEGRLILADGLVLASERTPDLIIDVATLTGAAVVALGSGMGALMSNDDRVADQVLEASHAAGEPMWRLPLVDDYNGQLESEIADLKNIGSPGEAGSITAGLFLKRFVGDIPWVHLDIAGPARSEKASGYVAKGGTAFSLRTILEFLRSLD